MFFTSLTLNGFGPHVKSCTYDFSNGVTFITGNNGSGKSTIFDAIQWVLFGPSGSTRTLKNRSSIINSTRQTATVSVNFVHDTYGEIKITRSLTTSGKHTLEIIQCDDDEKVKGGIRDKQDFISGILGDMRHDVFSSVYMLQSSPLGPPSSFIGANTTYRREILSKIVDPTDTYANLHKQAKKDLREAKKVLNSAISRENTLQEMYDSIEIPQPPEKSSSDIARELHEAEKESSPSSDNSVKLHRELERLDSLIEELEEESDGLFDRYDKTEKSYKENRSKKLQSQRDEKKYHHKVEYAQACLDVFEFKIKELDRKIHTENMLIDDYKNDLSIAEAKQSLVSLSNNDNECILCGSDLSHKTHLSFENQLKDISSSVECTQKRIDDITNNRSKMKKEYSSLREELHNFHNKIHQMESDKKISQQRMDELKDALKDISLSIEKNNNKIDEAYEQINSVELKIKDSEDSNEKEEKIDLDALYRAKVNAQSQEQRVAEALSMQREQQKKVEDTHEDVISAQNEVDRLIEEKERTSPNGVISDDIAQLMEDMSSHATQLYSKLFDADDDIVITDGDDEDEKECIMMVGDRDVATYSHGEQLRIYGCIQAGFTLSVYDRTDIWIPMMWDEPSLATDKEAVSAIFSIPEEITPEFHQSFIITRDESIDTGDNEVIEL